MQHKPDAWPVRTSPRRTWHSSVLPFAQVGAYYDAVVLSARNAFLPEMLREMPGFLVTDIAVNSNHPNSQGHAYLAELIVRSCHLIASALQLACMPACCGPKQQRSQGGGGSG